VEILDAEGTTVSTNTNLQGQMTIRNVFPWWPVGMNKNSTAYMYTLKVSVLCVNDFHIITMLGSPSPPVVCRSAHVLFTLIVFVCALHVYIVSTDIDCSPYKSA
jgi:hypothetical protein